MKPLYAPNAIPKSHELASEESVRDLSDWLEQQLNQLEKQFDAFVTKESLQTDLKISRG